MCGIVGIASNQDCIQNIISGLKALEYRGYDSSGIAIADNNTLSFQKSVGKISALENKLDLHKLNGGTAIGHTRWATHGKPSEINSHPFVKDNCALVHNGIIENFDELITSYSLNTNNLESSTDTEVIAEIYNKLLNEYNNPIEAIVNLNKKIEGTFSFAFLVKGSKSIYATRRGSPLVLGLSKNFNSISSDVLGLPGETRDIIFLEENDVVEVNNSSFSIFDANGEEINRKKHPHVTKNEYKIKGNYKHFMQKEIFHQPISIEDTILNFFDKETNSVFFPKIKVDFNTVPQLMLVACGTAYHSCMIAKYWLEQFAGIPTSIDIGSEYRYRKDRLHNKAVGVVVSQSGETMDTLECLKKFKQNNIFSVAIVNVLNSSIARLSDYILPTLAGPEIGVASTKAFTAQLTVLALLSIHIEKQKKQKLKLEEKKIFDSLFTLHKLLSELLENSQPFEEIANTLKEAKSIFYIGRGTMYPLALEGALKLKEITYKHCEGYAAGELKHGPLALIEDDIPVIALAPSDENFSKILSNIQEIKARGGNIIMITDKEGSIKAKKYCDQTLIMPKTNIITAPIIYSLPLQLIAYYLAVFLGTDVDQPRNLAKSVTVE